MIGYRVAPEAYTDLVGIHRFTRRRWDVTQADRYIEALRRDMSKVAQQPDRGIAERGLRAGYRYQNSGSHVLYYRLTNNSVEIMRVLHYAMDFVRHL